MRIDKKVIQSILQKTGDVNATCLMTFDELYALLSKKETKYIEQLLRVTPSEWDIHEERKGIEDVPAVVKVSGQIVYYNNSNHEIVDQYLPLEAYNAFRKLQLHYKKDTKKMIFVCSGYRSPANQAVNFLYWLKYYQYDFRKTLKYVSIPGYSEHSLARHTAIDFITQEGVGVYDSPPFGDFEKTPEYRWLVKNASRFGFVLTCPRNNQQNQAFEPWHWQYQD